MPHTGGGSPRSARTGAEASERTGSVAQLSRQERHLDRRNRRRYWVVQLTLLKHNIQQRLHIGDPHELLSSELLQNATQC